VPRLPLIVAVFALAVAGCGSDGDVAPQVPGPPAGVTLPDGTPVPGASPTATAEDGTTTEEGATGDEATGGATGGAEATPAPDQSGAVGTAPAAGEAPAGSGGGASAPTADGPGNDTAPPAGSEAEVFEDFCTQNPGAC
jgi:hypothetical protein